MHALFAKSPFFLLAALVVVGSCTVTRPQDVQAALNLPYDAYPLAPVTVKDGFSCPRPPAKPLRDLYFESIYKDSDPARATIDKHAQKQYLNETKETRAFENELLRMSNGYLRLGSVARAKCVLDWLDGWAREDALLGAVNDKGVAVRQWMLASFASAYAQVKDEKRLSGKQKKNVRRWLSAGARTVIEDYPAGAKQDRKANNHLYWAAWAVTITGIAVGDRHFYDWGITRARDAVEGQFLDDSTLPLEMARGKKALHYHIFAAVPLIMLAEAAARNGDDLYALRKGMLHGFVAGILDGMKDPSYFEEAANADQMSAGRLHVGNFAWMEAYNSRFPSPRIERYLKRHRPLFLRRTGGDMTFLYNE